MTIFGGCYMTKSEYMALPTAKEMMQALQSDPVLQNDDEACAAFNRRAQEEFEEKIKKSYGKYDPDIHYDFNRKKRRTPKARCKPHRAFFMQNSRRQNVELKDTIDLMNSSDYKDRFKAEYWQVKIRLEKLRKMIAKWQAGTLGFTPSCSLELLKEQVEPMQNYLDTLEVRAEMEGISV